MANPVSTLSSCTMLQMYDAAKSTSFRESRLVRAVALTSMAIAGCMLAGCSAMTSIEPTATVQGIQGTVHGGQQPVAGASIQLYAPGTTGYGSTGTIIASTSTDGNGNFTLPRPYTCPANGLPMILVAVGGNSGAGVNGAISEVAMVGPCSGLTASTNIFVSEVTTVAAAYALAPFASLAPNNTNVGTTSTNFQGLINAAGAAGNLASTTTGQAPAATSISGMVLPTAEMNTLADVLASCVNSGVAGVASTTCSSLFSAATPPGGTAPVDTFAAAVDIALNPGNNVAALYALATPSAPFQPTLTSAPGDFALPIQYTGGQIAGSGFTSGLAIDAAGNAWVGNAIGNNPKSISKISPAGVFLSGANGYTSGVAGGNGFSIDSGGNVWVNVAGINSILELNNSGTVINTFTPASLNKPTGIAYNNRDGSTWSADSNNQPGLNNGNSDFTGTTVTNATSTGADANGSPYGGQNGPFGVEIDGLGGVWIANSAANTTSSGQGSIAKLTPPLTAGNPYTLQNFSTGQFSYPLELAFDSANNVWVALANSVGKYSNAGVSLGNFVSVAANLPTALMVDGLGRTFVSNGTASDFSTPGSLTVFSSTGTLLSTANGSVGYLAGNTIPGEPFAPTGLAIDQSGNVWISGVNNVTSVPYQYVTELIGIAAPVVTPNTVASSTNKYGQRP
jgi:hypothetical protein